MKWSYHVQWPKLVHTAYWTFSHRRVFFSMGLPDLRLIRLQLICLWTKWMSLNCVNRNSLSLRKTYNGSLISLLRASLLPEEYLLVGFVRRALWGADHNCPVRPYRSDSRLTHSLERRQSCKDCYPNCFNSTIVLNAAAMTFLLSTFFDYCICSDCVIRKI